MDTNTYGAMQSELAKLREFQQTVQAQLDQKEQERLRALAEKGQIEEALAQQRKAWEQKHAEALAQASQIEQAWWSEKLNAVITDALAGRQFNSEDPAETSRLLRTMLAQELEAVRGPDGQPVIRHKATLRPAAEYLAERLQSKALAGLFRAASTGGAGADGSRSQVSSDTSRQPPPPGSVADQITKFMASRAQAWGLSRVH
jgi:hypothetical protein